MIEGTLTGRNELTTTDGKILTVTPPVNCQEFGRCPLRGWLYLSSPDHGHSTNRFVH